MVWTPPVNIPSLSDHDYGAQLFGMLSNTGQAFYQNRRDDVGDAQWQQEQERLSTAQALAQSNADRNYALELQKLEADQAAADEYYAAQPIYNPDTNTWALAQPSKAGGAASQVELPDGFQYRPTTQNLDLGTGILPTARGVPVAPMYPKDVSGLNTAQETGTARGKAQAALPGIQHNVEKALLGIDDLMADPDLLSVIGPIEGRLPAVSWSGAREDAQAKIDYVVGQVFQQAYDAIRGAGPISQYETQAASEAYARVKNQRVGDADYLEALQDFKRELLALGALAEQKAAAEGGGQPPPPQSQPITMPSGRIIQQVE